MSRIAPIALAALLPLAAAAQSGDPVAQGAPNAPNLNPAFPEQTRAPAMAAAHDLEVTTLVRGLETPWGIAILPDGQGYLVTEKPGRLRHVTPEGTVSQPLEGVPEVAPQRQGGLLDVATGPDFANDRRIYWTYAKNHEGGYVTAAARGVLSPDNARLTEVEEIFVQQPPSPTPMHYGSRIVFDEQGHAFITTGEHSSTRERVLAQDLGTSYGKVIRVMPDGSPPADNPFTARPDALPEIWSLGHRNIQGAVHDNGRLWTIEHGPRGGDELNLTLPGRNYGWPVISYGINYGGSPIGSGESAREGMEQPVYYWDPVIAPAGMVRYRSAMFSGWQGDFLISSLTPGGIVRLRLDGDRVTGEERLLPDLGRVRDIAVAPDGALLVLLNGQPDSIVRVTTR